MSDSKPGDSSITDSASDILRYSHQPLDAIFKPRTIAVVGATEKPESAGRTIFSNLLKSSFGGMVFPVNPKYSSILGVQAFPDISSIPQKIDLAVIVTPASTVPGIISESVDAGVRGAIIISAGFKEQGRSGLELEAAIKSAQKGRIRIVGPNCLGIINPLTGLNASVANGMVKRGNVAFISQSGALCSAILDWSKKEYIGFSAFISTGSMIDIGWGDLIYYLGDDPNTSSILIYMESIGDARSFLSAAREVSLIKPIILIKAGKTEAAAKAASSHTGALTGSDDLLDAAFRRSGVLRVNTIAELFYMAEALAKQPRPKKPKLMILTNAGGPGVLATDALLSTGGELATLSEESIEALNHVLPHHWSHNNPIDILGDAGPDRYSKALEIVTKDPNCDGLLLILSPQGITDPADIAEKVKPFAKLNGKPILASLMGGEEIAAGVAILNKANIPTFPFPDTAAKVFSYMWRYTYNLKALYETPELPVEHIHSKNDRDSVEHLIAKVRRSGRSLLTEFESLSILSSYGIPVIESIVAKNIEEAVEAAEKIGFPVILKLHSETITHKTDVSGVQLNLIDADSVRNAFNAIKASVTAKAGKEHFLGVTVQPMINISDGYELIMGSSTDEQFGPVILFGTGGQLVEVFKDQALALPPLNSTLARRMMERTNIYRALKGIRGRNPVDLVTLEHLMVKFSQLIVEQPLIKEIDINPFFASADKLIALDARILLHGLEVTEDKLPTPAIRPYPNQYVSELILKDASKAIIRPIRPEDEPLMIEFHKTLSTHSVHFRYFHLIDYNRRIAHERLIRVCFIDYDREMAFVIERRDESYAIREIIAVGRLIKQHGKNVAEFAIAVSDKYHRSGLGTELLHRLVQFGRDEKLNQIVADILPENYGMQRVCRKIGFHLHYDNEEGVVKANLDI